jgi:glutathione S-transferase
LIDLLSIFQRPIAFEGVKVVPEKTKTAIRDVLKFLDNFLADKKFIAGDNLTIADVSLLTTVASFHVSLKVHQKIFMN